MTRATRRIVVLVGGLVVVACWGCGGGSSTTSSTTQADVKGTVTIKGKPATGGEIIFDPSNINRRDVGLNSAKIGSDGTYTVKTLVGENAVRVAGPQVNKDPTLSTNQVIVDVKSGENIIPIDVK
jgi:hypothetical protein